MPFIVLLKHSIGKAAPIVYHKAKDITKTLYNDAKDLMHQPFQVLSNPLTMAAVGISESEINEYITSKEGNRCKQGQSGTVFHQPGESS